MQNKTSILENIKQNYLLLIILAIATILRFYKLDFQSLWMDEIYTMNVSNPNYSFSGVISEVNNKEGFPYIYFLVLNFLQKIFGSCIFISRGFSAVFGVLAVLMSYKLGEKLFNKNTGILTAILMTFNEYCIIMSQEARPYSLYLFGTLLSYYYLVNYLRDSNKKNAVKYGLALGLLFNCSFFALVNLFAQGFLALMFFYASNFKIDYLKQIFLSYTIGLLMFLPNIYKFYLLTKIETFWIPMPNQETNSLILKEMLGNCEITLFLLVPLFIWYLISVFNIEQSKIKDFFINKTGFSFLLIVSWGIIFFLVFFLKTYLQNTSVFIIRYFTSLVPHVILVFGISLSLIKNNIIRNIYLGILVIFSFLNLTFAKNYYSEPSKTQFREASQLIIDKNKNNEPVYTSLKYWYDFYLNNNGTKFEVIEKPNLDTVINEMISDSTKIKPFWYTDAHNRPYKLSANQLKFIDEKLYIDQNFDGRDAWTKHFNLAKNIKKHIDISEFNPLKEKNGSSFRFNLDTYEEVNNQIKILGWACFENIDAKDSKIDIILIKEGENNKGTKFLTQKVNRPDVTIGNKSKTDLSNSGFLAIFSKEKLQKGNYKIAIFIENKVNNKKGLQLTDKIINLE